MPQQGARPKEDEVNDYTADVTLKHHMVQSRQGALQAEARTARLLREAAETHDSSAPETSRVPTSRHRLAGALVGLVLTLGVLAGSALAKQDAQAAPDASAQEQVTRRMPGGNFIE